MVSQSIYARKMLQAHIYIVAFHSSKVFIFLVLLSSVGVFLFLFSFCRTVIFWRRPLLRHAHRTGDVWDCGFDRQTHCSPRHVSAAPLKTPAPAQVSDIHVTSVQSWSSSSFVRCPV